MSKLRVRIYKVEENVNGDLTELIFSIGDLKLKTWVSSSTNILKFEALSPIEPFLTELYGLMKGYQYLTIDGYTMLIEMIEPNRFVFIDVNKVVHMFKCFKCRGPRMTDIFALIQQLTPLNTFYRHDYHIGSSIHNICFTQHPTPNCSIKELFGIPVSDNGKLEQCVVSDKVELLLPEAKTFEEELISKLVSDFCGKEGGISKHDDNYIVTRRNVQFKDFNHICETIIKLMDTLDYDISTDFKHGIVKLIIPTLQLRE